MSILLCIPAFFIGALFSAVLLGLVPGLVFAFIFYGAEAYLHSQVVGYLMQPMAIIGGCSFSILVFVYRDNIIKEWRA